MKTVFYLSTCSTCKRILSEVSLPKEVEKRDIKYDPITPIELLELRKLAGSYDAIFSKKARNYIRYKDQELSESLMESLLLSDYTFLKRPIVCYDDFISIGNQKDRVDALKNRFN